MCQKTDSGHRMVATGMGLIDVEKETKAEVLQETELVELYEGYYCDDESFICAGPKRKPTSACFGDSGGPLVLLNDSGDVKCLYGVADAVGLPFCYSRTYFARVSSYRNWIENNM